MIKSIDLACVGEEKGCLWTKGYIVINNVIYRDGQLNDFLMSITTQEEFLKIMEVINGFFAFVISIEGKIYVVSDSIRTIPLFWKTCGNLLLIADDPYELLTEDDKIGEVERLEMLRVGYTTGNTTMIDSIFQTEAGTYLTFDNNGFSKTNYIVLNGEVSNDKQELINMLAKGYEEAIERLILYLDGRRAVVPLSGGLDGRFIINLLVSKGYSNILTFTYGKANKYEVAVSEKIAQYTGVEWTYVPYLGKDLQELYYSDEYTELLRKAGNLATLPMLQEWYAVKFLMKQGMISQEDVIIPGHTISSIAELSPDRLMAKEQFDLNDIVEMFMDGNYLFNRRYDNNSLKQKLYSLYKNGEQDNYNRQEAYEKLKEIGYQERQTKYIGNSVRTYEMYGMECVMPFWDRNLVEIWGKVPLVFSYKRGIYYDVIESMFPKLTTVFSAYGHDNEKIELTKKEGWKQKIKKKFNKTYLLYAAIYTYFKENMNLHQYVTFKEYMGHIFLRELSYLGMWMYRCTEESIRLIETEKVSRD